MARLERSDVSPRPRNTPAETPFDQRAFPPNPPRRRPWLLLFSALAVAAWLLFLAWMAMRGAR